MLDNETKRRIDTARDILVGKIPTPQQQVEQITIALIYKFMDDMDKESISFGGKPSYFIGDLEKHSFTNLFASNVGGKQRYDLYEEGLKKLAIHPSKDFPSFFRKIFEGAKVPYSDIETLSLFLKTISDFTYDHSEKLGDAFEYLLSVLGSQGDAGQFRTPRHIIDFIVEIIQPKKTETICDPACGTAGFLIAAYKHIINQHKKPIKNYELKITEPSENAIRNSQFVIDLTPDDRNKMTKNFVGYDISPDMVRLSLVNMYLHGFTTPSIYEYDTLTSEDRWSEYFDVVIANPPFMTPKGGIKPHKKFTVQANRSEVLFVDYIAEHIHPATGRAGIIVPEGIIFQSATAYKALRKMLVDKNYLYAVVSLPAGVFNPYSGVKTSILLMDKTLAKKTDKILFVKIENDGFDLGAQRREIDKNDLPEALNILQQYKEALLNNTPFPFNNSSEMNPKDSNVYSKTNDAVNPTPSESQVYSKQQSKGNTTPSGSNLIHPTFSINMKSLGDSQILLVEKKKIGEKEDYNLSIDRYRSNEKLRIANYEMVRLGDVCDFVGGYAFKATDLLDKKIEGSLPVIKIGNVSKEGFIDLRETQFYKYDDYLKKYLIEKGDTLIAMTGATVGKVAVTDFDNLLLNQRVGLIKAKGDLIDKKYLNAHLLNERFYNYCQLTAGGGAQGNISPTEILNFEIPLPPISIQQQIVSKIESYQAIINGAKQVVENYKPQINFKLPITNYEMMELGSVLNFIGSGATPLGGKEVYKSEGILFIRSQNVLWGIEDFSDAVFIDKKTHDEMKRSQVKQNDVLLNITGASIGRSCVFEETFEANVNQHVTILRAKNVVLPKYLMQILLSSNVQNQIWSIQSGGTRQALNYQQIKELQIPLPSLSEQQEIVKQIEKEQAIINSNKQLIEIFEQKIKEEINKLWKNPEGI
ncbi:MAG: N-6 DNA methylase [Bacteroidetes bacterium]|nr:N-6 DNA methylase [Bacteroidota bacterium]